MAYTDKELETILFNYKTILAMVRNEQESILYPFIIQDTNTGGSRPGGISNPTEKTGMALMDHIPDENEFLVECVQLTYSKMTVNLQKMMEIYYFERSYGMKEKDIAMRLDTDRSSLWRWRKVVCRELRKQLRKGGHDEQTD